MFDKSEQDIIRRERPWDKRTSIDVVHPLTEKRMNLLNTLNDRFDLNQNGSNLLGISYSTLESKGVKRNVDNYIMSSNYK